MLKLLQPAPVRIRLWQAGGAVALVVLCAVVANLFVVPERAVHVTMLGHDFLAFYTAGTFVRTGRSAELYDLPAVAAHERLVARQDGLDLHDAFGPWWNPPSYALPFAPLSMLPYRAAWATWLSLNVVALLASLVLLARMMRQEHGPLHERWKLDRLLLAMLVLFSMPCIMALGHAQNTCTSLLILTAAVSCWRSKRAFVAGLVGGLLCYKPQLAAVLAAAMVMTLGVRALVGLCVSGGSLLLAGEWAMPGSTFSYLRQLPLNLRFMQVEHAYLWERHVTLRAMWRMLLQGRGPGETSIVVTALTATCALALLAGLCIAWRRGRGVGDVPWTTETIANCRDRFIAAVIVATPLLMPFYFDYDLLLLAVPAVLYAREMMTADATSDRGERHLLLNWSALYLWLFINPGMTALTRVNGAGLLLSCLAVQHIVRACRRPVLVSSSHEWEFITRAQTPPGRVSPPLPLAA